MVAYSWAFFLPTILLDGLGFSLVLTYTLNFPPYVLAAIVSNQFEEFPVFLSTETFLIPSSVDVYERIHWR